MADNEHLNLEEDSSRSASTFTSLRGRQSVRATFKLTDSCIEAISIVAAQLGIKQKSLFDHLFSDTQILNSIASKVRNARLESSTNRIQKTYVLSRGALVSLEDTAKHFNAPRDVLIELSVQRLLPIISQERRRHAKRKTVFEKIATHLAQGRRLLQEAYGDLGEDDLITQRMNAAMGVYESAYRHMAAFLEKSEGIESFEPDGFNKVEIVFEDE